MSKCIYLEDECEYWEGDENGGCIAIFMEQCKIGDEDGKE